MDFVFECDRSVVVKGIIDNQSSRYPIVLKLIICLINPQTTTSCLNFHFVRTV